jgi:hypothetical protein
VRGIFGNWSARTKQTKSNVARQVLSWKLHFEFLHELRTTEEKESIEGIITSLNSNSTFAKSLKAISASDCTIVGLYASSCSSLAKVFNF